jgi:hypothetical protein
MEQEVTTAGRPQASAYLSQCYIYHVIVQNKLNQEVKSYELRSLEVYDSSRSSDTEYSKCIPGLSQLLQTNSSIAL